VGVLLAVTSVVGIALAAVVVWVGITAILSSSSG
jgi:hypothetical protein